MIKVMQFIGRMQDGGAETLIKDYAILIDKKLIDINIVVLNTIDNSANAKILRDNGIPIYSIYKRFNLFTRSIHRLIGEWIVPKMLLRVINRIKPDVIHIHLHSLHYFSKIASKLNGIKLIYTCHNVPSLMFEGKYKNEFSAATKLIRLNNLEIIALHDEMAKQLKELFNTNNVYVVHNGIDFRRFTNIKESKEEIREKLSVPNDAFVIGHVGRFTFQKNQEFLIKLFHELQKKKENSFLLMVGEGENKEAINQEIHKLGLSSKVKILSHRSDIPQLMRAMDVFVFPSRFEGLGIVLIEAQVVGTKCVVSEAIPDEAFISDLIVKCQLHDDISIWIDKILDMNPPQNIPDRRSEYDMNKEIIKLQDIYLEH